MRAARACLRLQTHGALRPRRCARWAGRPSERSATLRDPRPTPRVEARSCARPDGDMRVRLGGERLPAPAGPALAELHACESGHQVELRRPGVPKLTRPLLAAGGPVVVRHEALCQDVVFVEAEV